MTYLPRDRSLRPSSTALRKNMTRQERHLWYDFLRSYPVQWNRQRIVGRYILDFCCPTAALAVELDGGQHYEADGLSPADQARDRALEALGILTLRFPNSDVDGNFSGVCRYIHQAVSHRLKPTESGDPH